MSTQTKEKPKAKTESKAKSESAKGNGCPASVVWFEIPADNMERAKKFYSSLFGWKIEPFPGMKDYWHIDTGGADETIDGGMLPRKSPQHPITNYIAVASADEAAAKVQKLGGKVCMPKTEVPEMGFFVICQDTENNMFALWEPTDM